MLVMVMIVLFILVAGTFMEGSVLIIMLTPIFLPLITKYGIDPVHFGLIFIIAATIGNYTPPVGGAMFVVCQVLRCPIGEYTRESLPFLFAVSVGDDPADLHAGARVVRAGLDFRQGIALAAMIAPPVILRGCRKRIQLFQALSNDLKMIHFSSWPGLSRPSTSCGSESKTWMPGT